MPHYWLQISSMYLSNFPQIIRFSILVSRNRHNSQLCMNAWNFHISSFSLDLVLTSSVLCPANSSFFNQPKSSVHLLNSGHLLGFLDSPSLGCSLETLLRQYSGGSHWAQATCFSSLRVIYPHYLMYSVLTIFSCILSSVLLL